MTMSADLVEVQTQTMVPGGQCLGVMPDGRKIFVWNALPGEKLMVRLTRQKHSYAEGIAMQVIEASTDRIAPREVNYLATSPWQMMNFEAENRYKINNVGTLLQQSHLSLGVLPKIQTDGRQYGYRNKMEYSFWGDDAGLHLALHIRGSHAKQTVPGSQLAMPAVDVAANLICTELTKLNTRAGDLKTIIVRCDHAGNAVAALYTKLPKFTRLALPAGLKGLRVYYSNPKSPASVPTKLLYELGDCVMQDKLMGKTFNYDVDSFFQVNLPVYELALARVKELCQADPVDFYAGVGSIGLSVAEQTVQLIESDPATAAMARINAAASGIEATVMEATADNAIQSIPLVDSSVLAKNEQAQSSLRSSGIVMDRPIIFDPPRAGLHHKLIARVLEVRPPQVIYLSCNPATQMRDLVQLTDAYDVAPIEVYNFFPRTPHIETLAVLTPKN